MSESKIYSHYERCHRECRENYEYLQGRILTIIDASVADQRQVKAIKDLVKGEFVDVWANRTRDSISCSFRAAAKAVNDSFGNDDDPQISTMPN